MLRGCANHAGWCDHHTDMMCSLTARLPSCACTRKLKKTSNRIVRTFSTAYLLTLGSLRCAISLTPVLRSVLRCFFFCHYCLCCLQVKGKEEPIAVFEPLEPGAVLRTKAANNFLDRGDHADHLQARIAQKNTCTCCSMSIAFPRNACLPTVHRASPESYSMDAGKRFLIYFLWRLS